MTSIHPFDHLAKLEKQSKHAAHFFPQEEAINSFCNGVKFNIDQQNFVVDSREIEEVLPLPDITPLPDVERWVRGLSNIRGRIIPIFDLGAFIDKNIQTPTASSRVMLIDKKSMVFGIVVDEVQGIMQFSKPSETDIDTESLAQGIRPFITGYYYKDIPYMIFSTKRLMNSHKFINAVITP